MKPLSWHTEKRKVSQLIAWDKNPRMMSEKQRDDLHQSFLSFDYVEIIVINTDNKVIGGHQRLHELISQGKENETIEVRVPNRKLTPSEFTELAVRLNKNQGEWDDERLAQFFNPGELEKWGFTDIELTGIFDGMLEAVDDEFDLDKELAKIKKPKTKPGQMIQLGKHRLFCGDSTDLENWAALMKGKEASLQLTDPPYNVDYTGGTKEKLKISNDKMKEADFLQFLTDYFAAAGSVMKKGASSYVFHSDTHGSSFRQAFVSAGNKLAQCLVWVKNSIVMGRQDYHWQHEPVLYGWKKGARHRWFTDRKQSTVLNFERPLRNEDHPTMKPVELVSYLMKNSSPINSIVIDGFLGSGTTLIVAEQLGRICFGMDNDPRYCDVIIKRYEKLTGRKAKLIPIHGSKQKTSSKEAIAA